MCCLAAGIATASQASLVDRQSFTTDSVSGLDWLDLTITQGQSINQVASGDLVSAGWAIATYLQVTDLYGRNLGTAPQFFTGAAHGQSLALARMLGIGFSTNTSEGVISFSDPSLPIQLQVAGFFADGYTDQFGISGFGLASLAVLIDSVQYPSPQGDASAWLAYPRYSSASEQYAFGGVYLVRASSNDVPEPATGALALLALAGLVAGRKLVPRNNCGNSSEHGVSKAVEHFPERLPAL